jgi:hypothetical protein
MARSKRSLKRSTEKIDLSDIPNDERTTPESGADPETWLAEIDRAEMEYDGYWKRCRRIRERYRYEQSQQTRRRRFQLLWANIETQKPLAYSKLPKPIVEVRWDDVDDRPDSQERERTETVAATVLERSITFQTEFCDYGATFKEVRDDYLLFARGAARFVYEPIWKETGLDEDADEGEEIQGEQPVIDEEPAEKDQTLAFENVRLKYIQWGDLVFPKTRKWDELPWIAFRWFMTREELIERFGEELGKKVSLDAKNENSSEDERSTRSSAPDKAEGYEIWDKTKNRVVWVARGLPKELLDEGEPYLKLDGFWPMPKPAFGTLTNDTIEPVPDSVYIQDQLEEIDDLTARIASLSDSLKLVGFYPAGPQGEGYPEIERAVKPGVENRMIAIKSWAAFAGESGPPIVFLPVEHIIKVLEGCIQLRKQLKDDVHEITGISDIMRGDTDAEETATAQRHKSQWGQSRSKSKPEEMARFCRDCIRMCGEIIANHFDLKTMLEMSNIHLPDENQAALAGLMFQLAQQRPPMPLPPPGGAPPGPPMLPPPGAPLAQPGGGNVVPFHPPGPATAGQPGPAPGAAFPAPGGAPGVLPPAASAGPPPTPPDLGPTQEMVEAVIRDNITRLFRLDIETDSTIAADDELERQSRTAFVEMASKFVVAWGPIVQQQPKAARLAGDLLIFGARGFKVARELEDTIERYVQDLEQAAGVQGPPPIPPVEQAKIQIEHIRAQSEMARSQVDMQLAKVRAQAEAMKAQAEAQSAMADHQGKLSQMSAEMQLEREKAQMAHTQLAAETDAKVKTLNQTMQMQEQKYLAHSALDTFKMQRDALTPTAQPAAAPPPEPKERPKRSFLIDRHPETGAMMGLREQ